MAIGLYGPEYLQFDEGGPAAEVQIFIFRSGTKIKAQLFADKYGLHTGPNPVWTDRRGELVFFAEEGEYDLYYKFGDTTIPITVEGEGPGGGTITRLGDLSDVSSAGSSVGDALVKGSDNNWRGSPLNSVHTQDALTTVVIITHGLSFDPSGVVARGYDGTIHHPRITYPQPKQSIRLDFRRDFRGQVWLS